MSAKHLRTNVLTLLTVLLTASSVLAQPAKGANKFLGNITTGGQVRSDFMTYWNQITGENEHKWESVERNRDQMNWTGGDRIKTFAELQGIPWKFHTLIWGSQYPSWLTGLSQSEQLAEITEWYDATKAKYPSVDMIDVVNEAYPSHAPAPFKNALGGDGSTGYDWIINAFKMARERWPNAILIYNDYNNIEYGNEVNWTVGLINAMKAANAPIDAIGCQAHDAFKIATSTVKNNIDKLAATGLPIFITEYDIGETDDTRQLNIMKEQFTMFWNHPRIVGITYWGYLVGSTWRTGTGLLNTNGTERPALTWLKDYVKNNPNPPNDFPNFLKNGGSSDPRLTVSTSGLGTVTRSPNQESFPANTPVTLTATPSEGWVFSSWSGDASGNQNPLTVTMSASKSITAIFTTIDGKQDLIQNGNFSSGDDSWTFNMWSGDGAGSVVNGEYRISVNTVATNYYDIQVVQAGITLEQGKTYRLTYDAYASANRILNVNVGMPVDPWTTFLTNVDGETEVNLSTSKQTFSFDFTMESATYTDSRVEFSVGAATPSVTLDNVSLVETTPSTSAITARNNSVKGINIRQIGSVVNIYSPVEGNSKASLAVYDLKGNVVHSVDIKNQSGSVRSCSFNTRGMPSGYYLFEVRSSNSVHKSGFLLTGTK